MYLKSLELNGFKSFGKKSLLQFTTPITAIVGPNGSGKSNIAESFRFVLGEQSIKSMRGKKSEDLIFNGGKDAPRANRASSKLTFDNQGRIFNVDFGEVALERVVYRDASSEYLINGSQVRLKDITELLASAHIGASGHHIISQGEADRILNAQPRERREMLEDALGLKVYQYKRLESERKLDKTEENIKQVTSLRSEIAPHIKFLKKQVEKVEKSLQMKEDLKGLYNEYLKRESVYLEHARRALAEEKRFPTEELTRLDAELSAAKKVLEESKRKDAKSDEVISLEGKLRDIRSERDLLMRDMGRLEGEIVSREKHLDRRLAEYASAGSKPILLKEVEDLSEKIEAELRQGEAEQDIGKIRGFLGRIRDIVRSFIGFHKTTENASDTESEKREIANLKEKKKGIEATLEALRRREEEANASYRNLREEIEKEKDSSRDAEKAVFRIMSEQNEIRTLLQVVRAKEEKLRLEEENFKREKEEGAVLVGRSIFDFETFVLVGQNGAALDLQAIVSEDRTKQEDRRRHIEKLKIRLEDAGAAGGDDIMKEYKEATERDEFLARELLDLEKSALSLKDLIRELGERLDTEFRGGIEKINKQFQEFFSLMFGGGFASLKVVKEAKRKRKGELEALLEEGMGGEEGEMEEEETEEGVEIEVNLPRKKIKGLMMLSGGERALTSIALLFAVSQVNPPPFIILDETDAALDEANSKKYGDMIENLARYSQLILITHNRETMSRAGVIYGVTMDSGGISKLLSIKFDEAVVVAK